MTAGPRGIGPLPRALRGKTSTVEDVIEPTAVDDKEVTAATWDRHSDDTDLAGLCRLPREGLRIEVFETKGVA